MCIYKYLGVYLQHKRNMNNNIIVFIEGLMEVEKSTLALRTTVRKIFGSEKREKPL